MAIGSPRYNDRYVEQITTTVRGLMARDKEYGTNSLQQFAEKHKTDPIVMSVISTQRSLAASFAPREAQQPGTPPPVNEQLVASLSSGQAPMQGGAGSTGPAALPENQGIARLPMQTEFAAEGGIVGYADGGVARFNGRTESTVSTEGYPAGVPPIESAATQGQIIERARQKQLEAERKAGAWQNFTPIPPASERRLNQRVAEEEQAARQIPTIPTAEATAAADAEAAARLAKLEQGYNAGRGAGRVATSSLQPQIKPDAIMAQYRVSPTESVSRLENLRSESEAALRLAAKEREQGIAALGKYGDEELKRLKADEAKAPEEGKRAIYEAMIVAGLGMMGSQSQYALQGIAEGAMKGFGAYKGAMKDLKDAANERRKTMMTIEQMRRAEARGDVDRSYELQKSLAQNQEKYGEKIIGVIAHAEDVNAKMAFDITLAAMKENRADARVQYEMAARAALQKSQGPDFAFYRYLASKDPAAAKIYMEQVEAWSGAKRAPGEMSAAQLIASREKAFADIGLREQYKADPTYAARVDAAIMSGSPIPPYQPKVLGGTQSSK